MALNFDATIGGATSNSYATVEDFNSYVEKLINPDVAPKSSQTTLIKKLLLAATEVVDTELTRSVGTPTSSVQNLEYPRTGVVDRRGNTIFVDAIPQDIIDATCEMAIWLFENEVNNAQSDNWDEVASTSIGGTISFTYNSDGKPNTLIPARVQFLLERVGTAYAQKINRARRS